MEKVREVMRRGTTSRFFSPQQHQPQKRQLNSKKHQSTLSNGGGGDVDVSERSKKYKFAGGSGSDEDEKEEEELRSSIVPLSTVVNKRVKLLHSKPLSDCNGVDHAAIPRKLRSAMSKRSSRESLSPPLSDAKKHHHHQTYTNGTNSFQVNPAKKSKRKMKQGGTSHQSLGHGTSTQITKDEEEVIETLYALARMSPNNKYDEFKVDQTISEAKLCPLSETMETPVLVPKEVGTKTIRAEDELKAISLTESSVLDGAPTIKSEFGMHSSISPEPRGSLMFSNNAHTDDVSMGIAAKSPISSDHETSNRTTKFTKHEASFCEQNTELLTVAVDVMEQEGKPPIRNEDSDARLTRIEGTLALWPRLSTAVSSGGEVPRSSVTKAPVCPHSTASIANPFSKEEVNPVLVDRKRSLKKCATHVHLSRLILVYQSSEKSPIFSVASDQLKSNEGDKHGDTEARSLIEMNSGFNRLSPIYFRNGRNEAMAIDNSGNSMNEVQTKDKMLQAERQQPSLNLTLEKQHCDFLSLSVSSGGIEPINDIKKEKNGMESLAQVPVSYLHPVVQNVQIMPFPYHGRSSSSPYPDQPTVAVPQQLQFQLPQHMSGGPFYGQQQLIQAGSAKQHQQIWAAQYMPGGNPSTHMSNWQHRSSQCDTPLLISSAEPLLASSSHPSQQHRQQLFATSSQSHNHKVNRQHHPQPQPQHHRDFSGFYRGGAGGVHSEGRSNQLQLVCNAEKL